MIQRRDSGHSCVCEIGWKPMPPVFGRVVGMDLERKQIGVFLVLGPARAEWPEPLGELVRGEQAVVAAVGGMHEIAARVAGGNSLVRGVMLDPLVLMRRDLEAVRTLARYVQVPLVMLPLLEGSSVCAREAPAWGVLMWEEAAPALATLLSVGREPGLAEDLRREAEQLSAEMTDNPDGASAGVAGENHVTSQAANRYDELGMQPLVSPQELAALLGQE
jgi:hypothetical protein